MTERSSACAAVIRLRERYARAVAPTADGLPNARVIAIPLLILAAVLVGLVAFGFTGSSTGIMHSAISSTPDDDDLIAGEPQPIRSDEWFVQTTWTISQVEQGLPLRNETFPGGMDATVQHDLPSSDWSAALRPHLLGFFFLPLDQAMALKWWLPGFALIGAVFLFAVTILPRRPVAAAALGVGFFFAPFFQWWYLSITFYPAAWAFLVMAALVWCMRARRRVGAWILAAVTAYLTATVGTGIYVPFIIPVVVVVVAFAIGLAAMPRFEGDRLRDRVRAVVPVLVAGVLGAALLAVWAVTRWSTIVGFTSTVYPGERLQPTGQAGLRELGALLSGPLSPTLETAGGLPFGANSSEASSFLLPGLFVAVTALWLIVERRRARAGWDWLSIATLAAGAVMLAFMLVPGWDLLSHLLFLDRTTYGRLRLGFGVLAVVLVVLVAWRVQGRAEYTDRRLPAWVPLASAALATGATALMLWSAARYADVAQYFPQTSRWMLLAGVVFLVLYVGSVWLFGRGALTAGALVLLVISVVSTAGVNPLYRGVLDLRSTNAAAEIERLSSEQPGEWVGISATPLPTMLLVESGAPSFNGFQSAPSREMWSQIDPASRYEATWNRLANVSWVAGEGAPDPRNPAPDQIQMTFDSCDAFAQDNITWVLAETPLDQSCLRPVSVITDGPTTTRFYEVVAPG